MDPPVWKSAFFGCFFVTVCLMLQVSLQKPTVNALSQPEFASPTREDPDQQESKDLFFSRDTSNYINLMNVTPPTYLKNYKNPCWEEERPKVSPYKNNYFYNQDRQAAGMREIEKQWLIDKSAGLDKQVRCLPYFYVAGFTKCGTSDLYNKLTYHPDVSRPPKKEIHWWSRGRVTPDTNHGWTPISMYADLFDIASRIISMSTGSSEAESPGNADALNEPYHDMIVGEGSPSTVWNLRKGFNLPESEGCATCLMTPHYIRHITPNARIIISVRNPTSRLYSAYLYFGDYYWVSAHDFHEKVVKSIAAWDLCMAHAASHWDCMFNRTVRHHSPLPDIIIGMYHYFIKEWLEVFPEDQVKVIRLEDYGADRPGVLREVHQFLGLRPLTRQEIIDIDNRKITNKTGDKKKIKSGPMLAKTKRLLNKFYSKHNKALAKLLKDDRYEYS